MQVSIFQLFVGVFMWMLVMFMPFLISYFQTANPLIASALLTTLYPITLSYLARQESFLVSPLVIVSSSVISFMVSLLASRFTTKTTTLTIIQIITFVLALMGLSTQIDMYGSNVV
jgi:hypothetical protein